MTRVTSHRSATPAHITGHRAPTSYVRRLNYVVNNGPTPTQYNGVEAFLYCQLEGAVGDETVTLARQQSTDIFF